MIYFLGLRSELESIQQNLDEEFAFELAQDFDAADNIPDAELFVIGPAVENPIKYTQKIALKDPLVSIVIFTRASTYNQIKQSLLFSLSVGKNALCVIFNEAANYSSVFHHAITRTQQKRSFSKFNAASESKLAQLSSPAVKLEDLGNILEHAPIGAILVTREMKIIAANRTSRKMFSELNGHAVSLELLFPTSYSQIASKVRLNEIENPLLVEDRRGSYFEITSSLIPDPNVQNTILLVNDITERRLKNQRVAAILESLPQIAWAADADGNVNYFNQAWYNYTNKDSLEGMGQGWTSLIHPEDLTAVASKWHASVNQKTSFQHASRLRKFDGEYRWHVTKSTPIFNKSRAIEMWVGISTDIHDHVTLSQELDRKVKERTRSLERANAELEQFAYISSHDLQEPLRKIQTFACIIKDEPSNQLNDHVKRYIDKIVTTSARMSKLLQDLLSYSKIDQHEPESIVSLHEVIQQILEDLELAITQAQANITTERLPAINARPLQIKQLFYNLINNSLKYKKPDVAPVIAITCSRLENEKRQAFPTLIETEYWEIVIKDNGVGFDQKYAEQIFTVFQRLHARSAFEGTGIGLAIAKKVVANHRGEIFALSSIGGGAEFHIIFPAISAEGNAMPH